MVELLAKNPFAKLPYLPDVLAHPRWVFDYLTGCSMPHLPNVVVPGEGPLPMTDVAKTLSRSVVTWDDLKWIRQSWKGPIAIKGVHRGEDARRAIDGGADAVVVSNHGGRQLDGVPAGLDMLPDVLRVVNGQCEVLMDGGIRRGSDIAKALALGAKAVLLGRGHAYGLAAGGEKGVAHALAFFRSGLERTMKLLGCASLADLKPDLLQKR